MTYSFEGKRVLVTGGAGGLGREIVRKFYSSGAKVVSLDLHKERLEYLQKELPNLKIVLADLSKWDEVRKIVEGLGPLDHLVNNAGNAVVASCLEATEEQIDGIFDINFKAAFNLSQIFAKNVIANGTKDATIVNISSTGAKVALQHVGPAYCCSKAALDMLTKSFAVELGQFGIRVNSINPTLMYTYLLDSAGPEMRGKCNDSIKRAPLQGALDPIDAANLVLYLSSSSSKMITGSAVPIEGGLFVC